ncbi:low molecular weight phosphotyrosine protein phosphatase [Arthrobacter agilis]|uniref:low molecular weight protein-tyrosine-phosphatase n=1 Tax=Arthrobacter agilis TaxID=37921 RepID=UPI000B35D4B4|nr:low molecular weight protein-tyrosine-phosphatase [Arthrobacter agilis]OUM43096.1 protein tyrosine phosphatase [Arthrobacter agilis]PPB46040.1 low molecular weight phosphotyrosine protein phosphatase [Arthrobacter agilis]TPV25582.1 low molecular weight phosphotyrosine protein phosphatase [Arthrobacter agilis]WDF32972.1 low molecular weight phosphotyrosine protein phosphatase [Arthrobacter agilis]VDR33349.1 Probable low molecular weight protein-tyrosine-phosphatase [Arthrobacter agilis]
MYRIVTVCTGNICRSPMAELMLTRAFSEAGMAEEVVVDSAGTTGWEAGRPIDERAAAKLTELGIESHLHRARQFEPSWYRERDLVLALDLDHYRELRTAAPDADTRDRIHLLREFDPTTTDTDLEELGIYDPWYGDARDFEATWTLVAGAVDGVVRFVRHELDADGSDG